MRYSRLAIFIALAALTSATVAEARPRRVIVVHGRSFLDSGKQVPIGSQQNYVTMNTTLNRPIFLTGNPDGFGSSVLPGRFNSIGR